MLQYGVTIYNGKRDLKSDTVRKTKNGWVTARPIGNLGFTHRIRAAIRVLKGEADIVVWDEVDHK